MRPYTIINDTELCALGAAGEWDPESVLNLPIPSEVLWVHTMRQKSDRSDPSLVKRVRILDISGDVIQTDFGNYSLYTGRSVRDRRGIAHPGDCTGQLYLLKESHALSD